MLQFLKDKWRGLFPASPKRVTSSSSLSTIEKAYPHLEKFLYDRYRISLSEGNLRSLRLKEFVRKFGLPPEQILFMELQMEQRILGVKVISAKQAKALIEEFPNTVVFDTRDPHEWQHHGKIPGARFLDETNLLEEIKSLTEEKPILCYCHYGVKSVNFASQLNDLGFRNVHVIRGGIDEWSLEVDPTLPRYSGDYC